MDSKAAHLQTCLAVAAEDLSHVVPHEMSRKQLIVIVTAPVVRERGQGTVTAVAWEENQIYFAVIFDFLHMCKITSLSSFDFTKHLILLILLTLTRMHSSSIAGVCFPGGVCSGGGLLWGGLLWGGLLWGVSALGGSAPGGSNSGGGGVCLSAFSETTPPVNRMTNRCKNITLATTSLQLVIKFYSPHGISNIADWIL